MRALLVLLFVAVVFFATGEAIKCYTCASPLAECNDPFKKTDAVKETACPTVVDSCSKLTTERSNGNVTTVRSCGTFGQQSNSWTSKRADEPKIVAYSMHICQEDLCNGVSSTSAALSTLFGLAVPLVFFNYH